MTNTLFVVEKFTLIEACEKFFVDRGEDFFQRGLKKLPSKWQQVVEQNDAYLI